MKIKKQGGNKNYPTINNYVYQMRNNHERNNDTNDNTQIDSVNRSYDDNLFVRESHNCYTYFLNLKSKDAMELCKNDFKRHNMCRRAQPGYLSGFPTLKKKDYACPIIEKRTLTDNPNIYKLNKMKDKCDPRFYKGAMVVAPGRDYHYYRLNDDGFWTHKPGYKPTTHYDSEHNLILDPKLAARDYGGTLNYKNFCGYYCIPRDNNAKNMAHRDNKHVENRKLVEKAYETQHKTLKKYGIQKENNTNKVLKRRVTSVLLKKRKKKEATKKGTTKKGTSKKGTGKKEATKKEATKKGTTKKVKTRS